MIPIGPIYEFEGVDAGTLAEYVLGRDTRLIVRRIGQVATYSIHHFQTGSTIALTAKDCERLRETLEGLRQNPIPSSGLVPQP